VRIRSTLLLLLGAALSGWGSCALAATVPYSANFDASQNPIGPEWSIGNLSGSALPLSLTNSADSNPSLLHTHFLGDFGGTDEVKLHLTLPQNVSSVTLSFDAYLLRTWDGNDPTPITNARAGEPTTLGGPDIFGYGVNGNTLLSASFSHGAGQQTYCPGGFTDDKGNPDPKATTCLAPANGNAHDPTFNYALLDKLGYKVLLDPHDNSPNVPQVGDPMSMVYHFTSTIPYTGSDITFNFFSSGLQVHDPVTENVPRLSDESWGLDNVSVGVTFVPEPRTWTLLAAFVLLFSLKATRRRSLQR
jgi:hypothetical protein